MIAPIRLDAPDSTEAEALFAEARQRRRRRRLAGVVACLALAGSVSAGLAAAWPHSGGTRRGEPGAVASGRGVSLPPVRVAWVDYSGQLHLGNLATGVQHVVATTDASPADPMIQVGARLYWADSNKSSAPIRAYDIATGKIRYLARGNSVFASADGRYIYIARNARTLIELPAAGAGAPRQLIPPAGWRLSGLLGNWSVASGVVVYSSRDPRRGPTLVAVWTPSTGRVRILGRNIGIIDAYSPARARYSLLAWTDGCPGVNCRLGITNTSTLATLTIRSPNRYGFTYGGLFTSGAFSPDGKHLAVFVNISDPGNPFQATYSVPAIADTRTGVLRLVRAARLDTTEDVGWARWLPGANRLMVGAESGSYAVNASTLAARPFSFAPPPPSDIQGSGDINFSVTVLPSR